MVLGMAESECKSAPLKLQNDGYAGNMQKSIQHLVREDMHSNASHVYNMFSLATMMHQPS